MIAVEDLKCRIRGRVTISEPLRSGAPIGNGAQMKPESTEAVSDFRDRRPCGSDVFTNMRDPETGKRISGERLIDFCGLTGLQARKAALFQGCSNSIINAAHATVKPGDQKDYANA
jgi:hypothetical protein